MRLPLRIAGLLLGAALAASHVHAQPQLPWPRPPVPVARPVQQAVDPAVLGDNAEQLLRMDDAVRHYGAALQAATALPPGLLQERLRLVLPGYIRALTATGQLDAAELALAMLNSLPPPPQAAAGQIGFAEAMQALGAAFDIARQGARSLNQRLLLDQAGADADLVERALRPRLPAATQPLALAADLRARQGRAAELLRLWRDEFPGLLRQAEARPAGLRAAAVHELVGSAWHLGAALQAAGHPVEAVQALQLAGRYAREELRGFAPALDAQASGFQQVAAIAGSAALAALDDPAQQPAAVAELVATRGLATRYMGQRRRLLRELDGAAARQARRQLSVLEAELPGLDTSGSNGMVRAVDWENRYLEAFASVQPALERAGLSQVIAEPAVALQRLRASLGADEALIGFVAVRPLRAGQVEPDPPRYLRYTVTADGVGLADLGPQRELDAAVRGWRQGRGSAALEARLGEQLLGGMPEAVRAARRWVLDPDALLALLPFEVLRDPAGQTVLEQRTLRQVNQVSGFEGRRTGEAPRPELVVLADPAYSGQPLGAALPAGSLAARDRSLRDAVPAPLPETRGEAEDVAEAGRRLGLKPTLLLGADATPRRLAAVARPALLHIASHGAILSTEPLGDLPSRERMRLLLPGQLAALVLGADAQGPLFTAAQLEALDLRGTRLVVLSACDTGNGVLDPHEGLASLRHAAELAGARATLTSLWPVPSGQTARLMKQFYAGLADGQAPADALREAKLRLKRAGADASAWAGFVLAGSDR